MAKIKNHLHRQQHSQPQVSEVLSSSGIIKNLLEKKQNKLRGDGVYPNFDKNDVKDFLKNMTLKKNFAIQSRVIKPKNDKNRSRAQFNSLEQV